MARHENSIIYKHIIKDQRQCTALVGVGELAEISLLTSQLEQVEVKAVFDPFNVPEVFLGYDVYSEIDDVLKQGVDAFIICHSTHAQDSYDLLRSHVADDKIYAASFLHISRNSLKGEA